MITIAKTIRALGVVAVAYMAMTNTAYAGAAYCSDSDTVKTAAGFDPDLKVGNVTLNTVAANDCYGHVLLDDQSTAEIEVFANSDTLSRWFAGDPLAGNWDFLLRDEGSDATATLQGIKFTLSAPQGAVTNATWELDLVDTNGPAELQNIPLTLDFLVFIKGGTGGDYFFFDDRILTADNEGKFTMTFTQGGGNASASGLSGFSLLVRDLRSKVPDVPPSDIPEPHTLALMGLGLLAVGAMRRQRVAHG